jgi:hypothetical protein
VCELRCAIAIQAFFIENCTVSTSSTPLEYLSSLIQRMLENTDHAKPNPMHPRMLLDNSCSGHPPAS